MSSGSGIPVAMSLTEVLAAAQIFVDWALGTSPKFASLETPIAWLSSPGGRGIKQLKPKGRATFGQGQRWANFANFLSCHVDFLFTIIACCCRLRKRTTSSRPSPLPAGPTWFTLQPLTPRWTAFQLNFIFYETGRWNQWNIIELITSSSSRTRSARRRAAPCPGPGP